MEKRGNDGFLFDLVLLAVLPVLMGVLSLLPTPIRTDLALDYLQPTLSTTYTMHFVHLSTGHLLSNLAVYLLVVPVTYVLAIRAGRRRLFLVSFTTFLLAFPFVLSGLNLLFARPRVGYGFSGINMAFIGLLPLMLLLAVRRQGVDFFDIHHAPGLFFAGVGVIATLAVPPDALMITLAGTAGIAAVIYLVEPMWSVGSEETRLSELPWGEVELVGLLVFALVPFAAFPPGSTTTGSVLNLYTHLLGYSLGFIAPYTTVSILRGDFPWRAAWSGSAIMESSKPEID